MSWDAYVDSLIGKSKGHISKATIVGFNGAIWTPKTKDSILDIKQEEATTIGGRMNRDHCANAAEHFQQSGIVVGGTKYMFLRDMDGDGHIMTGKKAQFGAVTLQSTKQAVIIAFTPEGSQQGNSNQAVDEIAKYLEGSGY